LATRKLENEKDADFILNAASALSLDAVERRLESVALRWVSAFPFDVDASPVIEVPYRIGAAAIEHRQYRVAIAALNRLALIAGRRNRLSKELIALSARFDADGPSARQIARRFINKLGYSSDDFRKAAGAAVTEFQNMGDCASADAIQHLVESASAKDHLGVGISPDSSLLR
jgi:hypothetical protein